MQARSKDSESSGKRTDSKMFELLVRSIKDYAIFMVDPDGTIINWNEGARNIFGYSENEITGQKWSRLTAALPDGTKNDVLKASLDQATTEFNIPVTRKDGKILYAKVSVTPVYSEEKLIGFGILTRDLTERRYMAESLRQSEEAFRLMVSAVTDYAIFLLDQEGNILTWNEGAERIKGYTESEIVGKNFQTFYPQEARDRKHPQHELELALKEGRYREEGIRLRKDGSPFLASVTITPVRDELGHHRGFIKVTRDLSERQEAEERVRRAEDAFRIMVSAVKDYAIFLLDTRGNIVTWNEGAERIKGYKDHEIIGKNFEVFYPEEPRQRKHTEYELKKALAEGSYHEEGMRVRKDGSQFLASVTITPVRDADGTHRGFLKVTRDLSERQAAAEQLQQAEEAFRLMVGAVKDYAIFLLDPSGNVLTWNEGAQRIKGYTESEIVGKHFSTFYTQESKDKKWPEHELKVAIEQGHYEEEGWRVRKDGTQFWASVTITPVFDRERNLRGFVKVTRDLSDRRRYEIERERAREAAVEAARLKSEFVANVSHEIRTPMAGIIGMAEELLMDNDLSENQREAAQQVFDSSLRLLHVLNAILDFSKLESGKVELDLDYVVPEAIVKEVVRTVTPYATKKGIALNWSIAQDVPQQITSDATKLRQSLLNLVHNATKFTKEGSVDISITKNHDHILFEVQDSGIGIPEKSKEMLFQPFVQADGTTRRRYGGTGLGLSIAKRYVEMMHGQIGFDSTEDRGSKFWFTIPIISPVA